MHNFRKLEIWSESRSYCSRIYQLTSPFPKEEKFGLTNQLRRASVSIPSNIAEGAARKSDLEFQQFLSIALGSAFEIETQLFIAHDLNYISSEILNEFNSEIQKIQSKIIKFKEYISNKNK